ncbi:transient receptor potential cation channel subfamily A member 1-like isoform X1 [Zootermopsis nevadensis]|uniref:Transient receptor potential cation channel subfamily A member 1 n=1 Tax=Zootermopsis nevadensis TaxID=136037 RepID=A0A067RAP3_ZOONE|nr:transient receptor potential cation channel subfamily A member 1-like isoform X1 [Zootermopsis nevadensis]KDR19828.1 Transient receptor potential cation channel subfamily A member 1 [Zootermopsis nevadensis]
MVPPSKHVRISINDAPHSEQDDSSVKRISLLSNSSRKRKDGPCTPEAVPLSVFAEDPLLWPDAETRSEASFGCTSLHIAATEGNDDTVKALLMSARTDVNAVDGDGWASLHMAVRCGHLHVVRTLIADLRVNVNAGGGYIGCTPLHLAAMGGHHEVLKILLAHSRINVNTMDKNGSTALHILTKESCKRHGVDKRYLHCIISLMEKSDLKVNKPDMYGHTALSHAVKNGSKETVRTILQHHGRHRLNLDTSGADEMKTVRETISALFPEFKTILPPPLLEDLNSPNPQTRLLAAIQHGCLDIFHDILQKTSVNIEYWYDEPYYCTCLELACTLEGRHRFVQILVDAGANVNTVNPVSDVPLLHMAAKRGNMEQLNVLLNTERMDLNIKDCCQRTVLHCLARLNVPNQEEVQGLQQTLMLMLEGDFSTCRMIDLDAMDEWGNTALHVAARYGSSDVVDILLRNGADINVMDGSGETALHIAARDGNQDTVVVLMKHGADLMFTKFRNPPLSQIDRVTLRRFFDECLETNDKTPQHQDFRLTFNYNFLAPKNNCRDKKQDVEMPLLLYMSQDKRLRHMLKHPVITSFLYLKWNYARSFFYINLLFYIIFLCFLTTHVILTDYSERISCDNKESTCKDNQTADVTYNLSRSNVIPCTEICTSVSECVNKTRPNELENDQVNWNPATEIGIFENATVYPGINGEENDTTPSNASAIDNSTDNSVGTESADKTGARLRPQPGTGTQSKNVEETTLELGIRLGLTVLVTIFALRELMQFLSVTKQYLRRTSTLLRVAIIILTVVLCVRQFDRVVKHHCASIAVLLSWFEFLLRIGCIPDCSVLMQMLQTVSLTFVKFMSFYSPLIIAFSLCVYTMLRRSCAQLFYQNVWMTIMKSMLMLNGEYEASAMEFDLLPVTSHVILVLFILLIGVILLNLLSGLAVSDTQAIKNDAETLSLIARVRLISNIENLVCGAFHSKWIFPRFITILTPNLCSVFRCFPDKQVHVFPNRTKGNIYLDENEPRMNTAMPRNIVNGALKQISKRNASPSRGNENVQGTVLRGWGGENGFLVSKRMKDLYEQQEMLTAKVRELKELYDYKMARVEKEFNIAVAGVVSEVGVKFDLLSASQEKIGKELADERAYARGLLCGSQNIVQEEMLKQSNQILQLERKFSLLEETVKHTGDTVDQIFSFLVSQQRKT